MKDLSQYRKSYDKSELDEKSTPDNPLALFEKWFHEAEAMAAADEVNAMTVSTIGADGFPKSRIVLLKRFDENGFTFFTNYNSEKGKSIAANPNVCLSFFWPGLERQIIIKGIASQTPAKVSDDYFDSRPVGSRLGAVASDQSEVISSREVLEDKLHQLETEFGQTGISRPEHWGGYIVKAVEIEFWQGRANRLHGLLCFASNILRL
jgi:pyridoxamine 5'-phosphate oxidase